MNMFLFQSHVLNVRLQTAVHFVYLDIWIHAVVVAVVLSVELKLSSYVRCDVCSSCVSLKNKLFTRLFYMNLKTCTSVII